MFGQHGEITLGVAQAVHMVDAQSVDRAVPDQLDNELVGGGEDVRGLHPYADQGLDAEESAVVELVAGDAPVGQPVVLSPQQLIEAVDDPR